jgi:hypothetical protein
MKKEQVYSTGHVTVFNLNGQGAFGFRMVEERWFNDHVAASPQPISDLESVTAMEHGDRRATLSKTRSFDSFLSNSLCIYTVIMSGCLRQLGYLYTDCIEVQMSSMACYPSACLFLCAPAPLSNDIFGQFLIT